MEIVSSRKTRDTWDSHCRARLARLPYGPETVPVESFNFKEEVDGKDHSKYLWSNAAYSFGARLTDSFAKHGWCAAIRGVEGGGLVEGFHNS